MNLEDKIAQEMFLTENALKIFHALKRKKCSVYGSEAQELFGKAIKNKEFLRKRIQIADIFFTEPLCKDEKEEQKCDS